MVVFSVGPDPPDISLTIVDGRKSGLEDDDFVDGPCNFEFEHRYVLEAGCLF